MSEVRSLPHMAHWGAFRVLVQDGEVVGTDRHPDDHAPSPLHDNLLDGIHRGRIAAPSVREGWLRDGPGPDHRRGSDRFVEVSWDDALGLAAAELDRVRTDHGNRAIYGGSYGWASAGRFHHAQSQLHRFLNCIGGYTSSVGSYSLGASEVLVPHVLGSLAELRHRSTTWPEILEHTELVVAFGGMNPKNAWVSPGGVTRHTLVPALADAAERRLSFAMFSPLRDDLPPELDARWFPVVPGTDTAVMLGLAHVLISEGLHDVAFLDRYTVGWQQLAAYVLGEADGLAKTPEWAESISGIAADDLRALARRMVASRTLISVSWALQRAEHGEQPVWMGIALAALIGQIGLPGGGFGHGYGSMADVGVPEVPGSLPTFKQGRNPVTDFIPVARITELLTRPGELLEFDGRHLTLPDIRLVYWAGGNPFHHHQDLNGLRDAFSRPDTVIVNDPYWTGTARHADIVFPITTSLERDDLGAGRNDGYVIAMPRAVARRGEARDDYDVFCGLADRLGAGPAFSEGRNQWQWVVHLYDTFRAQHAAQGRELPDFERFWSDGEVQLASRPEHHTMLQEFRADPAAFRLQTPSGRIELFSETIDRFGYDDCPGHPVWLEPRERLGGPAAARFPLALVANQPATRLHGQLDAGSHSAASKIDGREPIRLHPDDARARGIIAGSAVRVFNDRGACFAGAIISTDVRPGVVQLSTGAWFDPLDPSVPGSPCRHGNPNVLTADHGTSRLAQGSIGQLTLVQVESAGDSAPPVRAHEPPPFAPR